MANRAKAWQVTYRRVRSRPFPDRRFSFVSRIVVTSIATMLIGFFTIFALVQRIIKKTVYNDIDVRVRVAQNTLRHLCGTHEPASIVRETLQFGSTPANDNEIVNRAKAIAGADARFLPLLMDGRPAFRRRS